MPPVSPGGQSACYMALDASDGGCGAYRRSWLVAVCSALRLVSRWTAMLPVSDPLRGSGLAISQDGTRVAYAEQAGGSLRIWVRTLDQPEGKPGPRLPRSCLQEATKEENWALSVREFENSATILVYLNRHVTHVAGLYILCYVNSAAIGLRQLPFRLDQSTRSSMARVRLLPRKLRLRLTLDTVAYRCSWAHGSASRNPPRENPPLRFKLSRPRVGFSSCFRGRRM
jgi:hypothetical protein